MKFKNFILYLYPHQKFILKGKYFKSKPLSKMENDEEVRDLVKGYGEEYVYLIHCINGCIQIELKVHH